MKTIAQQQVDVIAKELAAIEAGVNSGRISYSALETKLQALAKKHKLPGGFDQAWQYRLELRCL